MPAGEMAGGFGGGEVGLDVGLVSNIGGVNCAREQGVQKGEEGRE